MKIYLYHAILSLCLISPIFLKAQLIVDQSAPNNDVNHLISNVFSGNTIAISNVQFNGGVNQIAYFSGISNLGLDSGLVMSSGDVNDIEGPNSSNSTSTAVGGSGDTDLDALGGLTSFDAAVVEFDFVPTGDSIRMNFVFGSEEYDEYVCGTIKDAMGIFISGPGIAGPYQQSAENIALVPGTSLPISINSINNGNVGAAAGGGTCSGQDESLANFAYFVTNNVGTSVAFDGFTTVLTATFAVQSGITYHLKIAISDVGDSAFDSGLFLEAGSFEAYSGNYVTTNETVVDATCDAICDGSISVSPTGGTTPYTYLWSTGQTTAEATGLCEGTYDLTITDGSTTSFLSTISVNSGDLTLLYTSVNATCSTCNGQAMVVVTGGTTPYMYTWNTLQTTASISNVCSGPLSNTVTDGIGCTSTGTITVTDEAGPTATGIVFDEILCFGDSTATAIVQYVGGTAPITFIWDDELSSTMQSITNIGAGNYSVSISDMNGCFDAVAGVLAQPSQLIATGIGSDTICDGYTATLWGAATGGTTPYSSITWNNSFVGYGPHEVSPASPTYYTFTITDTVGCSATDSIFVYAYPELNFSNSWGATICYGDSATIGATGYGGLGVISSYSFAWSDGYNTYGSDTVERIVSPSSFSTYIVAIYDGCSTPDSAYINVEVESSPSMQLTTTLISGCTPLNSSFSANVDTLEFPDTFFEWDMDEDGSTDITGKNVNWQFVTPGTFDITLKGTSYMGCISSITATDFITADSCTNEIEEIMLRDNNIELFPNPVANGQKCSIIGSYESIAIYNARGQLVYRDTYANSVGTIETRGFPTGLYFLRLVDGEYIGTGKLIIE